MKVPYFGPIGHKVGPQRISDEFIPSILQLNQADFSRQRPQWRYDPNDSETRCLSRSRRRVYPPAQTLLATERENEKKLTAVLNSKESFVIALSKINFDDDDDDEFFRTLSWEKKERLLK